MLLGAVLPLLGEGAVAAGAPAMATRAATGVATAAQYNRMSRPQAIVAREASFQMRGAMQEEPQQQPAPVANPALDQLLANNDLTPFPNIQRALQESGGLQQIQHAFGSLNGQPLHPENNNNAPAVDPQSLLTPVPPPNEISPMN